MDSVFPPANSPILGRNALRKCVAVVLCDAGTGITFDLDSRAENLLPADILGLRRPLRLDGDPLDGLPFVHEMSLLN